MFFSFDGVDGAGKSTQMDLLCDWLRRSGREVLLCRDPGSTSLGESLRSILLDSVDVPIAPRSEMLLYMTARAQLVEEVIRPAQAAGKVVVCDRYLLANIVYQGHAGGLPVEEVRAVGRIATGGVMPDLTFVFDLNVDVALQRLNRSLDRMESRGREFLEQVRTGFLTEEKVYPGKTIVVDASRSVEAVHEELRRNAEAALEGAS